MRFRPSEWGAATGEHASAWTLRSAVPCTLVGTPKVTLLDRDGRLMPFAFDHGFMEPITRHPGPVVVAPTKPLVVAIDKYRCDTTPDPRVSRTARLVLPGVSQAFEVPAREDLCDVSRDGPNVVHVPPLGAFQPALRIYAVAIGSPFGRGGESTWGSADVDGDGRTDVVLLTGGGRLEVRLATGKTLTRRLPQWGRLQGFPDLNADGAAEILAGYTAIGCCDGYDLLASTPQVLTVSDGALRPIRIPLRWNVGHGDEYAGITCDGNLVTEVSTLTDLGQGPHPVRRVTWRIEGDHATRVAAATANETGDPLTLTATHCPGLDADGWAQ